MEGPKNSEPPVNDEGDSYSEEEVVGESVTEKSKMAATPGPKGTKRPLSFSPSTEEDKAENLKQGKNIVVSPPMMQDPKRHPKRRGIGAKNAENAVNIKATGNDPQPGQGKSCNAKNNMADQNNNTDQNDSGIVLETDLPGDKIQHVQGRQQVRATRKASL